MISEPELEGGTGFDTIEVLTEVRPPRAPRARRPWLWALGGAVLASAVWGGGLYAYERRQERGPDLRGYGPVGAELCEKAEFKALSGILGKPGGAGDGPLLEEPALLMSSCNMAFGSAETGYQLSLRYTLHKVTDPGPEFAAHAKYYDLNTPIEGIGDQAFFDDRSGEGGEMRVLDGQAEIELTLYRQYGTDADGNMIEETKPLDLSGIEVPMTQDVLALMEALKK
ncbi:hypothetical protein ACIQCR_28950 [Streptomyces sp. NPDC093249]|uniref:hypothetical protein n=1 Tax=unclassified Streptomyces TaxID=2593676 RepID=UPI00344F4D03